MKKILLAVLLLLAVSYSYAQFSTPSPGLTVTNDKVGIGAGTPGERLTIGDPSIPYDASVGIIKLKFDSGNGGGAIGFEKETFNTGGLRFYTQDGWGSSLEKMRITSNGNVGIGTTNPSYSMQIGDLWSDLGTNYKLGVGGDMAIGNTAPGSQPKLTIIEGTTGSNLQIQKYNGYTMIRDGQGIVNLNSKVGIGTNNPDAQLAVTGTIHAWEIKVDQILQPTPDYVFDNDYSLTSLKDVKAFIDQNHHLSEIPSAQEVAKDGINLGEMNMKLLKKIEELTLYLIEKDKQLKNQQEQLDEIKEKLGIKK